jgi:magnesium-transporting ATPase (P-type)
MIPELNCSFITIMQINNKRQKVYHSSKAWHALPIDELFSALNSKPVGLEQQKASEYLETYGPNRLRPPVSRSILLRFLDQFRNVLIYVLLVAGLVTAAMGHWVDTAVILGVVLINGLIGFIQEGKAERALEAVRNMLSLHAIVLRDGKRVSISAEELVPGDVVVIQSGDRVPADLRLFSIHSLQVDESMLTGESLSVEKHTDAVARDVPLGDRLDMAFSGTLVTFGQATGLVVATGDHSEIGRISSMLAEVHRLSTPLTRQMTQFASWLSLAILSIALIAALFGVLVQGFSLADMFLASVGLAVAAIPEGLPAIITITLAIGVQRMASRNAIVRLLPAVETLGSVNVICSDKTGTLTRNEMMVQSLVLANSEYDVSGNGYDPHGDFIGRRGDAGRDEALQTLCRAAILCNDAAIIEQDEVWTLHGDPMEGALIVLGMKAGYDPLLLSEEMPRTDVIPFESEHRFMATLHHDHLAKGYIFVKGACETLLPRCRGQYTMAGEQALDTDYWLRQTEDIASRGQRTLALAMRSAEPDQQVLNFSHVDDNLVLLGLLGIMDPPREEAVEAIKHCHAAGIDVKMITGDHAITAMAIARSMGITDHGRAVLGNELENMDESSLAHAVKHNHVFARTSPEHKLHLVQALQADGQVVAMTGDGVNDAPALKRADIGVAMGIKGSEAAKEAADMVLADDNFASIVRAVEEGRTVYDNIKKSILFILPTNGGEALTILAAIAMGRMLPVTAAQILWVNMITAVTLALSLAFEPAETDIMRRMPRDSRASIFSPFMIWRILFVSVLMVTATFGLFLWERNSGMSIEVARTVAVNTLVVAEIFYLFNTRYIRDFVLTPDGILGNKYALLAVVVVVAFQLLFTYLPLMHVFFHSASIDIYAWMRILAAGALVFVAVEIEKWSVRRLER